MTHHDKSLATLYTQHFDHWRARTDAALAANGFDHLLIHSGELHYGFLDDTALPFRVNPHFKLWIPVIDNPNSLLIYTPGEKPKLAFYSPVDFWHKTHPLPDDFWTAHFDITGISTLEDATGLLPGNRANCAFIGEDVALPTGWNITQRNPEDLLHHLHYQRACKTEYEIECLRRASRLGARAHRAAEAAFRAGAPEFEIHMAYLAACEHNEAQLPYGNIIALNEHAAVLHYQYQQRNKPESIRSFLIDAGACVLGYNSDITRTYSRQRDEFAALIDAMDEMQQQLCEMARPGNSYPAVHLETHRQVGRVLAEFGIADGSPEALLESRVTSAFFPHGVGHYLGAQVHDAGGLIADVKGTPSPRPEGHPYLRLTRDIEIGNVFTIEPGLYFIPSLLNELRKQPGGKQVNWSKVESFIPFGGIRIEDNIAVHEHGNENLTRDAFAAL